MDERDRGPDLRLEMVELPKDSDKDAMAKYVQDHVVPMAHNLSALVNELVGGVANDERESCSSLDCRPKNPSGSWGVIDTPYRSVTKVIRVREPIVRRRDKFGSEPSVTFDVCCRSEGIGFCEFALMDSNGNLVKGSRVECKSGEMKYYSRKIEVANISGTEFKIVARVVKGSCVPVCGAAALNVSYVRQQRKGRK